MGTESRPAGTPRPTQVSPAQSDPRSSIRPRRLVIHLKHRETHRDQSRVNQPPPRPRCKTQLLGLSRERLHMRLDSGELLLSRFDDLHHSTFQLHRAIGRGAATRDSDRAVRVKIRPRTRSRWRADAERHFGPVSRNRDAPATRHRWAETLVARRDDRRDAAGKTPPDLVGDSHQANDNVRRQRQLAPGPTYRAAARAARPMFPD
jgi:hypothetical protein